MTENYHLCTIPGAAASNEPFESSRRSVVAVLWSTLEKHLLHSHGWALQGCWFESLKSPGFQRETAPTVTLSCSKWMARGTYDSWEIPSFILMQLWISACSLKDPVLHLLTCFAPMNIQNMLPSLLLNSLFSLLLQGTFCDIISNSDLPVFHLSPSWSQQQLRNWLKYFQLAEDSSMPKYLYELEALGEKMGLKQ